MSRKGIPNCSLSISFSRVDEGTYLFIKESLKYFQTFIKNRLKKYFRIKINFLKNGRTEADYDC